MPAGRVAKVWRRVMLGVWTVSTAWLGMSWTKALLGHKQGCLTSDPRDFLWVAWQWTGNNGCFSPCGRISQCSQVLGGWCSQLKPTQKRFLLIQVWSRVFSMKRNSTGTGSPSGAQPLCASGCSLPWHVTQSCRRAGTAHLPTSAHEFQQTQLTLCLPTGQEPKVRRPVRRS